MGLSSKFKPGIVALVAVGVVVQLATALPQIERLGAGTHLTVSGSVENCEAVATALNSLKYGSSSITGVGCDLYWDADGADGDDRWDADGGDRWDGRRWLETNEPNDVELLNTLLALSVKGYSAIDVDMHGQLADLKALLTPECTANRLARAQGNPAADPANSSDRKTNIAAIVVPIVAVLLVAAIAATVLVMKGRGADAYAEVERRAANVPPATTQPNPAFTPADAADAVPEPGSDEDIDL